MKSVITASLLIFALPAVSFGQSDLQKIGNFLQGIQELQQQQQPQQQQPQNGQQPPLGYRMSPGNPNSSGDRNRGQFGQNNFFGQSNGQWQTVPQNGHQPPYNNQHLHNNQHPQHTYPNGTYPNNGQVIHNHQQNGTYPNNTYPSGTYPSGTYPQGTSQHQPHRNGNVVSGGNTVYADPPTAPIKKYSGLPIVLRCAPGANGTCNYDLMTGSGKAYPYTINGGQTQNLTETTDWAIRYRARAGASYQTYRLRGGKTYEIHQVSGDWHFYMVP